MDPPMLRNKQTSLLQKNQKTRTRTKTNPDNLGTN